MNDETTGRPHWSFWTIGAVALIWNLMGCLNFIMQMNADALANYSEAARALVVAACLVWYSRRAENNGWLSQALSTKDAIR